MKIRKSNFHIACIVPICNGIGVLGRLLDSLQNQTATYDLMLVDSSSSDGTYELAQSRCKIVERIPPSEFNHGGTRQMMADKFPNYDIYVYLTQDAELVGPNAIESIITPFSDPEVGAAYGRQIPHQEATPLAQHARIFNYPAGVQVKSMEDVPRLGIKTAFMSNSFAAYRKQALNNVGGFPSHVIFGEDMYVAAKMLLAGWKVVYAGNAVCRHSHNYTIVEEFERYFDIGVFHARERWIRQNFGSAGGEGMRYVKSELKFLGWRRLYMWPSAIVRNTVKLLGYKLGQQEAILPVSLKRKFSMHKRYWDSPIASKQGLKE